MRPHPVIPLVELQDDGTPDAPRCLTCGEFVRRGGAGWTWQHYERRIAWRPNRRWPYWTTDRRP